MKAAYINKDGKEIPYFMGCYGIGVSRTVATIYEESVIKDENNNVKGFALNQKIAPYLLQIIPKIENEKKAKQAEELYKKLHEKNIKAILDDRKHGTIGSKMKDCKVLGTPYMAVLGDKVEDGYVELENIKTGEKQTISVDNLIEKLETI